MINLQQTEQTNQFSPSRDCKIRFAQYVDQSHHFLMNPLTVTVLTALV